MYRQKLEKYKNKILTEMQEVEERIRQLREEATDQEENYETNRGYPTHQADMGTESFQHEKDNLLISREQNHLMDLQRALQDIESGNYGVCQVCGKEISEERLDLVPTTRFCAEDARAEKGR